jgi:hypothetical protein
MPATLPVSVLPSKTTFPDTVVAERALIFVLM